MKKIVLIVLLLTVLITVAFVSCKKNQEDKKLEVIDLSSKTESQKISIFSNDKDWKLIANKNLETINKLVNSNIDINNFDFSNEEVFLKVLGKTRNQYINEARDIKEAANRLLRKYKIGSQPNMECISCKTNSQEAIIKIKRTIKLLKENKESYSRFENLMEAQSSYDQSLDYTELEGACCPWRFYACVTLCAATIEFFPAYLLCCGFCFDTYCCK
jgi:hypothetical protein